MATTTTPAASAEAAALNKLSIDRSTTPIRRRKPLWKRWWLWVAVVVVLGGAALVVGQSGRPVAVEIGTVAAAYPSAAIATLNATGRVSAARRASVSSKATGRLEWLGVQEGQRVEANEIIARLENRDVSATREQAAAGVEAAKANLVQGEAEFADADANLKRSQELAAKNFIAASAVDTAIARANKAKASLAALAAQIKVAEANLRAASVAVEQTLIRAPFTGIVLTKSANVGDIVTPFSSASGTTGAVVTMADMSTLEVEVDVSEASIAKIKVEQPAEIQLDAFTDLRLAGSVSRIVPTVDRSKATLLVKVRFDETDARVLPDMSSKVAFLTRKLQPEDRKPVAALRPEAIVKRDGKDYVYVVAAASGATAGKGGDDKSAGKDAASAPAGASGGTSGGAPVAAKGSGALAGRATLTAVTLGPKVGDLVRVDNLSPGTRVIINPPANLEDGKPVAATKK